MNEHSGIRTLLVGPFIVRSFNQSGQVGATTFPYHTTPHHTSYRQPFPLWCVLDTPSFDSLSHLCVDSDKTWHCHQRVVTSTPPFIRDYRLTVPVDRLTSYRNSARYLLKPVLISNDWSGSIIGFDWHLKLRQLERD